MDEESKSWSISNAGYPGKIISVMNRCLIYVSTGLSGGRQALEQLLWEFRKHVQIQQSSSVYKRYLTTRREDLNSELVIVVQVQTSQSLEELQQFLAKRALLLAFENEIRMVPGLAVPHPQLQQDNLTLHCSAEAWPDYVHPVTNQTLGKMVSGGEPISFAEFYTQAQTLFGEQL